MDAPRSPSQSAQRGSTWGSRASIRAVRSSTFISDSDEISCTPCTDPVLQWLGKFDMSSPDILSSSALSAFPEVVGDSYSNFTFPTNGNIPLQCSRNFLSLGSAAHYVSHYCNSVLDMIVQLMEIDISELERVLGSLITDNMVTTCKWFSFYKRTISRELCTDVLAFSDYVSNSYESIIDNTAFYINKQNGYSTYLSGALNEVNFIGHEIVRYFSFRRRRVLSIKYSFPSNSLTIWQSNLNSTVFEIPSDSLIECSLIPDSSFDLLFVFTKVKHRTPVKLRFRPNSQFQRIRLYCIVNVNMMQNSVLLQSNCFTDDIRKLLVTHTQLPPTIDLARGVHNYIMETRISIGWGYGTLYSDMLQTNPDLVNFVFLNKQAQQSLIACTSSLLESIVQLGFLITKSMDAKDALWQPPLELIQVLDFLSESVHSTWVHLKTLEGWSYRKTLDVDAKFHPALVRFQDLSCDDAFLIRCDVYSTMCMVHQCGYSIKSL